MTARESWGSRFGFIMATAGFSIGLGNIWRFSYLAGQNGGGAWVLVYLLCAMLIGIPLFTAEIAMGRKGQAMPISALRNLTGRKGSFWNLIGWLGITAAALIMTYYLMLIAWIVGYLVMIGSGHFTGMSTDQVTAAFPAFIARPGLVFFYTVLVGAATAAIVAAGVQKGIERASKIMMPALFILLFLLLIRSLTFPGAMAGLSWYLKPDFSKLSAAAVLAALGQCFFSIGIGMAGGIGFGSYLKPRESDVPGNAATVVVFDTFAALLVGAVIFPALFAFGLQPDSGPGLLFATMPNLFDKMPAGQFFGGLFFLLVLLAGLTSAIALVECLAATVSELAGIPRKASTWITAAVLILLQVPIILSQGPWADIKVAGRDLFGLVDWISGDIFLPVGGILVALFAGWVWGFRPFREDANQGATWLKIPTAWSPFIRFVIPATVGIILLRGVGLL
ncbi:MAG: sodium-dependent transporter [Gemmatimonadetes bacterium]|nr:sodium-dependent transporter [Gemmatimonadota bacterium]